MNTSLGPTMDNHHSGFTLVEIAMVLFIVALLLAGLLPAINAQLEQQRTTETLKKISEIKEALIGFAIINGRLPCSADGSKTLGQAGYGTERASCGAGTAYGVVPWITLGTSETDAWGNRFTYRVTSDFADATDGTSNATTCSTTAGVSFQLCSTITGPTNLLTIQSSASGTVIANKIPVIIISHGKNGYGAFTTKGTTNSIPGGNLDEVANTDHISNVVYVSHPQTTNFDDLVDWISPNILFNRMVAAGRLP